MILETPVTEALARLQRAPLGNASYAREQADDGRWETVWLVRDDARRLAALGPEPAVEFRTGAFDEGGVVVLPILLRLGAEDPGQQVYDTYMNAYQIEGENVYVQDLARQDHIRIHLYDDAGQPVQTLTSPNRLREWAMAVLERQTTYQPSTTAAFEYARQRLSANYRDVHALWQALGPR